MQTYLITLTISVILFLTAGSPVIYEWRGKDRTGIFNETGLLKSWPLEGPAEIWSIDGLGNGFVSPVFAENEFYITGETDSITYLYCYNLKGERKWKTMLGREWMRSYPGSRSIPTIVDDLVYVGTGMGNLYCVKRVNGKLVWSKDLLRDLKGALPLHGHSEAALIEDDKVFWMAGGKTNNVVALDRFTGKTIWSNPGFGEPTGYNSPKLIKLPARNILVTFSSYHMMGFDTKTGNLLWSHEQDNTPVKERKPGIGDTHCNTVLFEDGAIYYAAGDGNCGVKLRLSADGSSITEVWRNKGFDSYMGGIVKFGNFIYGGCTSKPELRSVNSTTGEAVDSLKVGTGALIAADNMLYYYTQKGDLMLCSQNQGRIEMISTFRIKKGTMQHFSHPVINRGILYQRHGNVLMAYDIRKK